MGKYLIINPFGIGDVLFTTPAIKAIRQKEPDSFIGYWCNERVASLLKNNPDINKIFALSRGDIKRLFKGLKGVIVLLNLIGEIRKEKFDASLDFSLDSRYGLWSKLAGIKKRVGFDYRGRGRFLTEKIALKGYSGKHVVEYYGGLLKFFDIKFKEKAMSLKVSDAAGIKAKEILAGHGVKPSDTVVGMAMGGGMSWGRDAVYKQWPPEKFAQVAKNLINEPAIHIVLLGSADEKPLANIITEKTGSKNILDLTGKIGLEELAAIIEDLDLLICNDGGPLHMAVALGINTVSIFGPVDGRTYGPYPPDKKHIVIKKELPCRPCYENFRFKGCVNNKQCLEEITVEEVCEGAKGLLSENKK